MSTKKGLEYAPKGLLGVLTPQANTTVEPEFSVLCPPGYAFINARMTSLKDSVEGRLLDYFHNIDNQITQFANAPIDSIAFAATGSSYLVGKAAEDSLITKVLSETGVLLITAARAVCDALLVLAARRIILISPYPPKLTESSIDYWLSRGLEVIQSVSVYEDNSYFHPIYSLGLGQVRNGLKEVANRDADAIIMLGTGMPSLALIADNTRSDGPPILSCMLALVWRSVLAANGKEPEKKEFLDWISATHWHSRLPD